MFTTTVHVCRRLSSILICALLLLGASPLVVHSQEESSGSSDSGTGAKSIASTTASTSTATTTSDGVAVVAAPPKNPYRIVGIPGDASFVVGDFVVSPGNIEVRLLPGESRVVEMTVTNRTGELRRFKLTVEDAAGSDDPSRALVLLGDARGPYSLKDYISYPAESFELDHNKRAIIPVTISLPPDAEPGGLYGSVLAETVAVKGRPGDPGKTAPQSAVVSRIGTLFFVRVAGDVAYEGSLAHFASIPEKQFFNSGPVRFGILFENTGSIHLAPYGEIEVTNMFGDEVGFVELEPWFVLPDSFRLREVTWTRDFLFGKYTAIVRINRSYDDIIDTMEYTFWVLPWKLLGLSFVALFTVLFLIRLFFKTFEFKRKRS